MKLKHTYLTGLMSVILSSGAMASDDTDLISTDGQITLDEINAREVTASTLDAPTLLGKSTDSTANIDVVIFYQNSFIAEYGDYDAYYHFEDMVASVNEAYETNDIDALITIRDVVQITSVQDDSPYMDVYDDDGNFIEYGASYYSSLVIQNEGYPEYDTYQKWQADLVMVMRDYRSDSSSAGAASVNGEYSIYMNLGTDTDLTTATHEIGHNMGARHEIEDSPDVTPVYAHATECNEKQTVMNSTVSFSNTYNFYSSPDITQGVDVCGDEDEADNSRVVSDNVATAAARRDGVDTVGSVSFDSASYSVYEDETLTVTLTRDGDLSNEATVKVYAKNDTAEWGQDYLEVYQVATFAANESSALVSFTMVNDTLEEDTEEFSLSLKYPYTLTLGDTSETTVYLSNVENLGDASTFSLSGPSSVTEGESGTYTVTRSGEAVGEVVIYATSDTIYDATNNEDYLAISEELVFAADETTKTFTLDAWEDYEDEANEALNLNITSDASVSYDVESLSVDIIDTDEGSVGEFDFTYDSSATEGDTFDISIERSEGWEGDVTINITTSYSNDLVGSTYSVTMADNESEGELSFTLADNSTNEDDYTMTLTFSTTDDDAVLNTQTGTVTIANDDTSDSSGGGSFGWLLLLAGALLPLCKTR